MKPSETIAKQISSMCRAYPRKITSFEMVGRAYALTTDVSGPNQKVRLLVDDLEQRDRESFSQAIQEVLDDMKKHGVGEFRSGTINVGAQSGNQTCFEDQAVPNRFLKQLKRALDISKSVGSSRAS